jgi:mercuric ion binding protein
MALAIASALPAPPALAAERAVTLAVTGMTCATCPLTVRLALTRVAGVRKAEVDYDKRQAVVLFDDAQTDVAALIRATTEAGYPSTAPPAAAVSSASPAAAIQPPAASAATATKGPPP